MARLRPRRHWCLADDRTLTTRTPRGVVLVVSVPSWVFGVAGAQTGHGPGC